MLQQMKASSSSFSKPQNKYDVFLSFRGETGKTFTSHLHNALCRKRIHTFLDVEKLEGGEDISMGLDNAIEGSRCAVVVVSGNYASSRWCMDALVQILKCRKDSKINQIVLPIFYHVNQYDLLKEKGTIWEGFQSLKEKFRDNEEKVKSWKDALIQLANIAGHPVDDGTEEAIFIEDFINVVSSKVLNAASLSISKDLVGMDSRLGKLKLCISRSSSRDVRNVRFIGICGMGGLGKTTLARAYFKYMSYQFEASSFLADVRQACENEHDGLVMLKKQLLTDVLKGEHTIYNVFEGKDMIRTTLCDKKTLVVLDDVDQLNQLEGLAEESHWFGDGSQIIVTTRNQSLLPLMYGKKEYTIHKVDELDDSEALQLFSLKAFKSDCPPEDYGELSAKVIKYASGLPLALVVLGSLLRGKHTYQWENALDRLKKYPEKDIMKVHRISFDGLEETEKIIFLDIACFFNGCSIDYVMKIMDCCGFFPEIGIRSLVDKSLLHIDRDTLRMHNFLQEMGKEIVLEKSRNEPGRRSRIWLDDDLYHVLNKETGTEEVEAIVCKISKNLSLRGFSNMKKLRMLIINTTTDLSFADIEYLPNELRFLEWDKFPFKSFPRSFQPHELVELILRDSRVIARLWDDPMMEPLYNLKSIDLSGSQQILKLENFSLFPNLKKLILNGCEHLKEIDPSFAVLKRLTLLSLERCKRLKSLPTSTGGLKSLKVLNLSCCSSLGDLPKGKGPMVFLNLSSAGLSCLEKLDLRNCGLRDDAFPDDFGCLASLEYLDLSRNEFSCLPAQFNQLSKLRHLDLSRCENLTSLGPELPDSLETIEVNKCGELHTFLDPLSQCNLHCSAIYCLDCFKLVKRQGSKRTAITSLGRYLQNPPKRSKRFDIVLPGTEIPSWFTNKVKGSSSISLPLDPNWCTNKWRGFALSACFSTNMKHQEDWFWEIKINEEDWGFGHVHWAAGEYMAEKEYNNHIWLLYLPRDTYFHSEWHKKSGHIQFSFKLPREEVIVEIKQCGVHLVYEEDIEELSQTDKCE
ncbi:hypothetical protein FNV43_RR00806 [Rhamnella rubrinervis]|uniref:ADP-ribosyl cyclase/cyclic ADP-ribose hydrolase n=1 Tax=Rhamnella rubrinervis TaxID=2594499 RepID=A0A8K0MRH1_9ROSA|nr:hypothetical protein FNV43_RR00806 [Rhamnella rubrinervis]